VRGLYFDTCAFAEEAIMMANRLVGPDKLLFGTDYPYIDAGTQHVDRLPITERDRKAILGGNAQRLFGFAGPDTTVAPPAIQTAAQESIGP
jgi:aminocarboxymuconate-semialdehyde decarboxylase